MSRTAIVIDADACVPAPLCAELGIVVAPADAPLLLEAETVSRLSLEAAAPDAEPVAAACANAAEDADAVLYIACGDGYGAAVDAAPLARAAVEARSPGTRFVAFDSEAAVMGAGWQAVAAARAVAAGGDLDAAIAAAAAVRESVTVLAALDHPELSGAGRLAPDGRLRLRAVAELSAANIEVIAAPSRRDAALVQLRDQFHALATPPHGAPAGRLHVAVQHAAAGAGGDALATWIARTLAPDELFVAPLTRHAATRLGPRMIGVAWYREPPP